MLKLALLSALLAICSGLELTLLHVNDIHVRFEETNAFGNQCKPAKKARNECFGGSARVSQAVKDLRDEKENVLFLNAGDFYQGNAWYTIFKWEPIAQIGNLMGIDAMTLGNHEFDDSVEGLAPFLRNVSYPVVCANLDLSHVPELQGLIKPSVVFEVGGTKVGVVGFILESTPDISNPGDVGFLDEIEAVQKEVDRLKAEGINIIIGLGHSGYEREQEVAKAIVGMDVLIGGHSHTFLYSGPDPPSTDTPAGPYPTLVEQESGQKVLVVQAKAYTKYLGKMELVFNEEGELTEFDGEPILLDHTFAKDPLILEAMKPWQEELEEIVNEPVAETLVDLLPVSRAESNLGNLVTDAMVHWWAKTTGNESQWSSVGLAVINSGGLRGAFEIGEITLGDVYTVMPFANSVDVVDIEGKYIREAFEKVAEQLVNTKVRTVGFLQASGFEITMDLSKPKNERVTSLLVKCTKCTVPKLENLEDNEIYRVAMPNFLSGGGDGHSFDEHAIKVEMGPLDTDVFNEFVAKRSPIMQGIEGRFRIINNNNKEEKEDNDNNGYGDNNGYIVSNRLVSGNGVDCFKMNNFFLLVILAIFYLMHL